VSDITLLYYTSNLQHEKFAAAVRQHHLGHGLDIVSVSQKPIEFGYAKRICVGEIGASIFNCYKQILRAAEEATTPWVACIEDDAVYPKGFFDWRPKADTFGYGFHLRLNEDGRFWFRKRTNMCTCIAPRELLIETLKQRFEKYPEPPPTRMGYVYWGEPGRFEGHLGLPIVKMALFDPDPRPVVFNHRPSLGGVRRINKQDQVMTDEPHWGNGKEMAERFQICRT
jgi:hypothetical protein